MSFLLPCPHCGPRDVYEFRWGGEQSERPAPGSPRSAWVGYLYLRANAAGEQREWWFHRAGCGRWFLALRDTRTNEVKETFWPGATPTTEQALVRAPASPAQAILGEASEGAVEAPSDV